MKKVFYSIREGLNAGPHSYPENRLTNNVVVKVQILPPKACRPHYQSTTGATVAHSRHVEPGLSQRSWLFCRSHADQLHT